MESTFFALALVLATPALAQLPNLQTFGTAANGEVAGVKDQYWKVSTSPTGPFEPAVVIGNCEGFWFEPTYAANWITYDQGNGCTHNIDLDLYFQRTIQLPASNSCGLPVADAFYPKMGFYADNCIQSISVNGVVNYTFTGNENECDNLANLLIIERCKGWQPGQNLLTVHVKSTPIAVGFMAFALPPPSFPLDFLGPDTLLCSATSFTILSPDSLTRWFDGNTGQTKTILESGQYWAARLDAEGCEYRDTVTVFFNATFYLPNSFSPNGDGINDEFRPGFAEPPPSPYLFRVFDRWGGLVFESKSASIGWDGNHRGKPCSAGIYTYLVQYGGQGCPVVRSGEVLLLL